MPSGMERIPEQRLQKLANIRAMGIDPYPHRYKRTHTAQQAVELLTQQEQSGKTETDEVSVAGRIMANRTMGKISFHGYSGWFGENPAISQQERTG